MVHIRWQDTIARHSAGELALVHVATFLLVVQLAVTSCLNTCGLLSFAPKNKEDTTEDPRDNQAPEHDPQPQQRRWITRLGWCRRLEWINTSGQTFVSNIRTINRVLANKDIAILVDERWYVCRLDLLIELSVE